MKTGTSLALLALVTIVAGLVLVPTSAALRAPTAGVHSGFAPAISKPRSLTDPTVEPTGHFGASLASSAKILVVGEPGETPNGGAYLFHPNGSLWSNLTKACSSNCTGFGSSVAVAGSRVAVGAPGSKNVLLFGPAGKYLATFTSPCPITWTSCGGYGTSVALAGNMLFIGAPVDGSGWYGAGTVYVYNLTTDSLAQTLTSPYAQTGGCFGRSVAADGALLVVGAPCEKPAGAGGTPGTGVGNVYIFNAGNGTLVSTASGGQAAEYFGWSVAVNGSRVIAGAPDFTPSSRPLRGGAGGAFVFSANGSGGFALVSPHPNYNGAFGTAVAIGPSWIAVGAPDETVVTLSSSFSTAGHVYLFNATGGLLYRLSSPNLQVGGGFGSEVALAGLRLLVAAPHETVSMATQAGHSYAYHV